MVAPLFKVKHVMVDGAEIAYVGPDIPVGVKWVHVVPWKYNHGDLPHSWVFCFTDTVKGKNEMKKWLQQNCLWRSFEHHDDLHNKIIQFMKTPAYTNNASIIDQTSFINVYNNTQSYVNALAANGINPFDSNLVNKLYDPAVLTRGSIHHCSTVFSYVSFNGNPPNGNISITTNDVMNLSDQTFIANLNNPPPPNSSWQDRISSAQVLSGCLRLFDLANYAGPFLFLWGPYGSYPDLSDFAFDDRAKSLQQSP